jgi:hypothetical protein
MRLSLAPPIVNVCAVRQPPRGRGVAPTAAKLIHFKSCKRAPARRIGALAACPYPGFPPARVFKKTDAPAAIGGRSARLPAA